MRKRRDRMVAVWLGSILAVLVVAAPSTVMGQERESRVDLADDVVIRRGTPSAAFQPAQTSDPHGLLVGVDAVREHSLGSDVVEVWTCGVGVSPDQVVSELDAGLLPYFTFHSRGRYQPDFMVGGVSSGTNSSDCLEDASARTAGTANAAFVVDQTPGGLGSPGWICFSPCGPQTFPDNSRYVIVGYEAAFLSVAAHELGHSLHWPHSYTGSSGDEYDNALDLMSGNFGTWESGGGTFRGTHEEPYDTAVANRYAAGWMDPAEVYVMSGGGAELTLSTMAGPGYKMAAIRDGDSYFTMAARIPSEYDPIHEAWAGVEVYRVTPCPDNEDECIYSGNHDDRLPGFRRIVPHPAVPFDYLDEAQYDQPLDHVISEGETRTIGGVQVTVEPGSSTGFEVSIGPDSVPLGNPPPPSDPPPPSPPPSGSFSDTGGHVFASDIEWLAQSGITRGCNPPANTLFCPEDAVTRGQMAAFLVRALVLSGSGPGFDDTGGHVFEGDIERLAAADITRGCNPPANTLFCPDDAVSRGQMAAFLVRALDLTEASGTFDDTGGHVFEAEISRLAGADITRGCNPPADTLFCPEDAVTRGQMAAFLNRALGGGDG